MLNDITWRRRGLRLPMLGALIFAAAPPTCNAAEVNIAGAAMAPVDLYLADDFTDRGCATAKIVSRYEPMLGYNESMATQIDSYLSEDFTSKLAMTSKPVTSTYLPLAGYIEAVPKH